MYKTYLEKTYTFFNKSLNVKIILILIIVGFVSLNYSFDVKAVQITDMESNDLLDQYSDMPQFEIMDEENQTPINELKYYLHIGSYSSVLEAIANLSEEEKNKSDIISIKAAALIGKDDFALALNEYNRLKNRKDTSSQHFSIIANMLLKKKKPSAALMVCQSGLMRNIKSAKLLYQMGYAFDSLGKPRTALVYHKQAKPADITSHELKQQTAIDRSIAVAYYKLNDFEKAKNAIKGYDIIGAKSGLSLIINAKYHASIGDYDKAISILDDAQESSKYLEAYLTKVQVLILNSKPKEAIDLLHDFELGSPQSNLMGSVEVIRSLAYLLMNRPKDSLAIVDSIKKSGNKPANIELVMATIHMALGDKPSAIQALKGAPMPFAEISTHDSLLNHMGPPALGPIFGLAYFCLDQGFYRQTEEIVKDAMAKTPNNIFLHFLLAESYRRTGKHKLALSEFKHLTRLMPESYALRFIHSKTYEEAGMPKQAINSYAKLSKDRPDFLLAQLAYGKLLERSGEWSNARLVYESSLNFNPDSIHLLTVLGWTLIQLQDFKALAPIIRKIKDKSKAKSSPFWHLEGWRAYKKKNYPKAVEDLSKALNATPGDPEICYHLGMALYSSGQKDVANNLLKQAFFFPEQKEKYLKAVEKLFP